MELYQIRYFLAIVETQNFTRAAERCFVSQPALTKAIQRLEETMGGRLFERARQGVLLTDLGRAVLPNFRHIFDTANQTREKARLLTREPTEVIHIGVMCTIDFDRVLPGFASCQDGAQAVELVFRDGNLEALTDELDKGEIDLGLMCSPYDIPKRFKPMRLFSERYVVAMGSDHRFHGRSSIALAEIHRERYCDRTMCEFSSHIERLMAERQVDVEVVQESPREDWIQAFVRANFGIAFMPESLAKEAQLAYVHVDDCLIEREVHVLAQADRAITPTQQAVIDALMAYPWGR